MSNQNLQTEGQGAQVESGSASEASAGAARQEIPSFDPYSLTVCESGRGRRFGYVILACTEDGASMVLARDIESEANGYYIKHAIEAYAARGSK